MDTQAFQRWLAQVSQLSGKQKSALHQALQELPTTKVLDSLPALQSCPHCQAKAEHQKSLLQAFERTHQGFAEVDGRELGQHVISTHRIGFLSVHGAIE